MKFKINIFLKNIVTPIIVTHTDQFIILQLYSRRIKTFNYYTYKTQFYGSNNEQQHKIQHNIHKPNVNNVPRIGYFAFQVEQLVALVDDVSFGV